MTDRSQTALFFRIFLCLVKYHYPNSFLTRRFSKLPLLTFEISQESFSKTPREFSVNMRYTCIYMPVFLHNYSIFLPEETILQKWLLGKTGDLDTIWKENTTHRIHSDETQKQNFRSNGFWNCRQNKLVDFRICQYINKKNTTAKMVVQICVLLQKQKRTPLAAASRFG